MQRWRRRASAISGMSAIDGLLLAGMIGGSYPARAPFG
jgi:hypothetical protein